MPPVGSEHTNPVFEGVKTVHALDRAVTVFGPNFVHLLKMYRQVIQWITDAKKLKINKSNLHLIMVTGITVKNISQHLN
jgi:hypothetical protein